MTVDDMLADYWAHHYYDNPNAGQEEFENPDYEADFAEMMGNPDDWEDVS